MKARILLVDDHPIVREGLRSVLQVAGHTVVGEAERPAQALQALDGARPDLVLLDLNLGAESGLDLLRALANRTPPVPCIMLSMSGAPHHLSEARRHGARGYVLKGSPSSVLLEAILTVLGGGQHFPGGGPDDPSETSPLQTLSQRERQIIAMVARGMSSATIAQELDLSPKTVDTYRSRLMAKLGVSDLPSLIRTAIRLGIVGLDE